MKGILFQQSVWEGKLRALKEYGEAETRRLIKPQPEGKMEFVGGVWIAWVNDKQRDTRSHNHGFLPRYHTGETVYVKEAWRLINVIGSNNTNDFGVEYFSPSHEVRWWRDNGGEYDYPIDEKMRSPMFLSEKFARYFIEILEVRPERLEIKNLSLQEINLEGGESALKHLQEYDGKWVWVYRFKLSPKLTGEQEGG